MKRRLAKAGDKRSSVTMRVSRRALTTLAALRTTRIEKGIALGELRPGRLVEEAIELLREKEGL